MSAIEFRGVSKRFGGFYANRNLSFQVLPGTIHGLIGENGAGKSTAMKALFGIYPIDEGEILIRGKKTSIRNPVDAMKQGIGMVHQHFMLAGTETVLDNIVLGHEPGFLFLKRTKALEQLKKISTDYGLGFDRFTDPVDSLSVGEQQRVEILKLLYQKSDVLILDEPTAVLTPQEVKELFQNLKRLKTEGKTIILISHKLKEVLEHTDHVTILRRGESVKTLKTSQTNEDELAHLMVGRPVSFSYTGERRSIKNTGDLKPVLQLKNISVRNDHEPIRNVSLTLLPGEIVGVAGVQGNGQSTLLHFLNHPKKFLKSMQGEYWLSDSEVSEMTPTKIADFGVGLVPEDRLAEGLLLEQDLTENYLLGHHHSAKYQKKGFILRRKVRSIVEGAIKQFDIRPPYTTVWLGKMSGGNQQKLVIARALDANPKVLYVAHPTRGVDVGAIEKIHEAIVKERNLGKGILLFSSELDELIDLCDRIVVFYNGEIKGQFLRSEFDAWNLGKVMGGGQV